ncbi:HU family DNA-binding protein [Anaerotignum sp.]|uniref:HU family DNA-binding protein n=1 Tax=Anaerotignum sp. TaxID=2039241 RepID=UPI0028982894|nr:HU family DNA-binding protein [Anaerotignum sp.]
MITKKDIVERISEISGMKKVDTRLFLNAAIEAFGELLEEDGKIKIVNFGKFEVRDYKERLKYNPQTEKMILVPACKRVKFTCGKELFQKLNK